MQVQVNNSERARIDSSGRFLVGTSTARTNIDGYAPTFQVEGNNTSEAYISCIKNGNASRLFLGRSNGNSVGSNTAIPAADYDLGFIHFVGNNGTNFKVAASITAYSSQAYTGSVNGGYLTFSTTANGASSPTERLRITQGGEFYAFTSDTGLTMRASQGAGTTYWFYRGYHSASSTTSGGTSSYVVYTNGNVQNTNNSYGAISDIKLKKNIVDANSQWDDIKALQVRKYNFKEGQTHTQIGLIAQEVELVSPGLVSESPDRDEEGNDLGTTTKSVSYSVLYMKAVKALQEAMERIEQLETSNADLLARVTALEAR
jgi:hypothetical protein